MFSYADDFFHGSLLQNLADDPPPYLWLALMVDSNHESAGGEQQRQGSQLKLM